MIKDIIFHQLRDSYHVNGLKALNQFNGKIASFNLCEKSNRLGYGQGIVFYEGKKPTAKEIHKFVDKNLHILLNKKHINGYTFPEEKYVYIRAITKL